MNILHVLSQHQMTGAEVYAAVLIDHQISDNHQVFQISNGFYMNTKAAQIPLNVETKSFFEFYKNVLWLRRFLIREKIRVIHTHSRAAAKLAFAARAFLKIGMVSTIHGRQHTSFSKKLFNQYGDFLVCVCENIQDHLHLDFGYNLRRMKIVRNPLSAVDFVFKPHAHVKKDIYKIAIVGRTTGPKGLRSEKILNVLPAVLKKLGVNAEFYLIGGHQKDLNLTADLVLLEDQIPRMNSTDYQKFDLIIGAGRVAMEAILAGIPTLAFGEANYLGLVKPTNLSEFYKSNFGDIATKTMNQELDPQQIMADTQAWLAGTSDLQEMAAAITKDFNSLKIHRRLLRLYESAYFLRNYSKWIPILMYHKIPPAEIISQHKIFVTAANFKKHLQFFKWRGFTTLTFNDLKKFKNAELDFNLFPKKPLLLTFDDGYQDNLDQASPLLKELGFKAQLFLLANKKINSNYWDHSEKETAHEIVSGVNRLKWRDSAFEIGSHGIDHKKITALTEDQARLELRKSKRDLENEFGSKVSVFAFTYGDTHAQAAVWALEEGYDYALNTDSGGLLLEENPYQIFRVNIFPTETMLSLFKKTSTWYRAYYFWKRKI